MNINSSSSSSCHAGTFTACEEWKVQFVTHTCRIEQLYIFFKFLISNYLYWEPAITTSGNWISQPNPMGTLPGVKYLLEYLFIFGNPYINIRQCSNCRNRYNRLYVRQANEGSSYSLYANFQDCTVSFSEFRPLTLATIAKSGIYWPQTTDYRCRTAQFAPGTDHWLPTTSVISGENDHNKGLLIWP